MWAISKPPDLQVTAPSGTTGTGKRPGAFWSQILAICGLPKRQVKAPSGSIGKRPCSAKSWPGAFRSQILALCGLLGASGKLVESSGQTPGNRRAPASSARRPENTKAQAFFADRFSQSDASSRTLFLVTLKLYFAFLKLGMSFRQPETFKGSI